MKRLWRLIRGPFVRLADAAARSEVADLQRELKLQAVELAAAQLENEHLAAVVARDRTRVAAETAELAERVAKAGGA